MSYNNNHVTRIADLKLALQNTKNKLDVLSSRIDANVTASTASNSDYAAEVADTRADEWGNVHGSAGSCVRNGQARLQSQIDSLAAAYLEILALITKYGFDFYGLHRSSGICFTANSSSHSISTILPLFSYMPKLRGGTSAETRSPTATWNIRVADEHCHPSIYGGLRPIIIIG